MAELQNIQQLISENRLEEALNQLDAVVSSEPQNDEALYMRGKLHWRLGHTRLAINDYNSAVLLNPNSPAKLSLSQANEILAFYHTDLYNP